MKIFSIVELQRNWQKLWNEIETKADIFLSLDKNGINLLSLFFSSQPKKILSRLEIENNRETALFSSIYFFLYRKSILSQKRQQEGADIARELESYREKHLDMNFFSVFYLVIYVWKERNYERKIRQCENTKNITFEV